MWFPAASGAAKGAACQGRSALCSEMKTPGAFKAQNFCGERTRLLKLPALRPRKAAISSSSESLIAPQAPLGPGCRVRLEAAAGLCDCEFAVRACNERLRGVYSFSIPGRSLCQACPQPSRSSAGVCKLWGATDEKQCRMHDSFLLYSWAPETW